MPVFDLDIEAINGIKTRKNKIRLCPKDMGFVVDHRTQQA